MKNSKTIVKVLLGLIIASTIMTLLSYIIETNIVYFAINYSLWCICGLVILYYFLSAIFRRGSNDE